MDPWAITDDDEEARAPARVVGGPKTKVSSDQSSLSTWEVTDTSDDPSLVNFNSSNVIINGGSVDWLCSRW